jgi:competence protein ComEC
MGRLLGLLGIAGGVALAGMGAKPDILVERRGATVAIRSESGLLVLPLQRLARFSVEKWLLREGDAAGFAHAVKRPGWQCSGTVCRAVVRGSRLVYLRHDTARGDLARLCGTAEIVIAAVPLRGACRQARLSIDRFDLWRTGAHAIYSEGANAWRVVTVRDALGSRPWVIQPAPRASLRAGEAVGGRQ